MQESVCMAGGAVSELDGPNSMCEDAEENAEKVYELVCACAGASKCVSVCVAARGRVSDSDLLKHG